MHQLLTIPAVLATLLLRTQAQDLQTCYGWDKSEWVDNVVCEDSGACCNAAATCTEQRLCHNAGDPPNVFVRGPCSSSGWNPSICPQICTYPEGDKSFPRVTQCDDGSWCCHSRTDVNSTTCCDNKQGTFLNERGEKIDAPVSSSSLVPVSTVPIASATASPSASASATPTPEPDTGMSTGAKIGIGVGVGGGVLALIGAGLIGWFFMKRSRQNHSREQDVAGGPKEPLHSSGYDEPRPHYAEHQGQYNPNEYYKPPMQSPPVEAPGSVPGRMYSDHGRVEADNGHVVGELPAEVPRSKSTEKA